VTAAEAPGTVSNHGISGVRYLTAPVAIAAFPTQMEIQYPQATMNAANGPKAR